MISKIKYYTAVILVFLFNIPVYSAPNGANVVHGDVNISKNGSNTIINQNTDKAIINWNSFDINKGERVLFNQNSSSSIILNRVTNGLPTNIFGNISANGNVFILNQAGVLVGNGASINTNSFLAGAANINDNDFIAGKYNFYGAQGNIINNGSIKVQDGGYAVLIGKNVANNGLISAKFGKIYLSSGETFRMDMSGNDLIGVEVEKGITDAYISNAGHIQAEGGTIIMTAKNASDVIRQAVNNTGIINASSISYEGGRVILGAENGQIVNNGEINVSSKSDDGGYIEIKSEHIINDGLIYANGLNGGLINMLSSDLLKIGSSSIMQANSFGYGSGGNIKLISQKRAEAHTGALIEASSIYGSGGFIELSGYDSVYAFSNFNTKSLYGIYGQFLLDPSNMFIGNYSNLADDENNKVSSDGNTYIDIAWLNNMLNTTNVSLQTFEGNGSGNITLNAGVTLTGTHDLTFNAANNISLLGNINGLSALILKAGGSIEGNNSINVGDITANAVNNILLTKLNVTGKSSYISSTGDVNLVGDSIGLITSIAGQKVGIEVTGTGNGISMDTSVGTDNAAVTGQEITLKADGAVNISVDTASLSAESVNDSLSITNLNRNETVLIKYFGGQSSTYTQKYGVIDLSYIPENAIGQDLTISSVYGTVKAVDRLDALKQYAGLKIDANNIHFIENNDNLLTLDSSFLGNKKAVKYIFETNGDITVNLNSMASDLLNSGIELVSKNGAILSSSDISASYFSANALKDINVTSYLLGGISLESSEGNITYAHKAGPIRISGLKALNGNINISLVGTSGGNPSIPGVTLPPEFDIGDLYISFLASNNPVNINTKNANVISIAGSGETALNLNITNGNTNPYKLAISNNYDITLNTTNTQYSDIKLDSNGNIYFPVTNDTLTAVDKIYLSANHINGDRKNLTLLAKDVYINQKSGSNSFIINAERADINGSNISVEFTKDTILADIDKDDYSVSGGSINIISDYNVTQHDKIYAADLNIAAGSFTFGNSNNSVIQGNNISIIANGDISGFGKIIADKVYLSASTIASTSNLLVLADYGHFISTAVNKPANDILININSDNWFKNLKSYKFEAYGDGLSYLNGRIVDYKIYDMVKNIYSRNLQPIENTNIDKVTGDDLIKGGRLQDTRELVTIEDNKTPKVNTITKKNKSIELK
ncbi:MAG: filamentous hemagglutinin N-terminal domain-containing protein [Mucispirillum sp.]|nr:filamentous hemagglutinin N-terminal domain-containing protein [Mucispirillum sp.]